MVVDNTRKLRTEGSQEVSAEQKRMEKFVQK